MDNNIFSEVFTAEPNDQAYVCLTVSVAVPVETESGEYSCVVSCEIVYSNSVGRSSNPITVRGQTFARALGQALLATDSLILSKSYRVTWKHAKTGELFDPEKHLCIPDQAFDDRRKARERTRAFAAFSDASARRTKAIARKFAQKNGGMPPDV